MTLIEKFVLIYLTFGVIYSTLTLYITRDIKATIIDIMIDGLNCMLFYPYMWQLRYKQYQTVKKQYAIYKNNKAYYDKLTNTFLDSLEETLKQAEEKLNEQKSTGTDNRKE
jgi:hypothetical protein